MNIADQILFFEKQLLDNSNRKNIDVINQLIHTDFKEIVEDGSIWDRAQIVDFLISDNSNTLYSMTDYSICIISDHVVIISYHLNKISPNKNTYSYRSSLWVLEKQWQMLFHQVLME